MCTWWSVICYSDLSWRLGVVVKNNRKSGNDQTNQGNKIIIIHQLAIQLRLLALAGLKVYFWLWEHLCDQV